MEAPPAPGAAPGIQALPNELLVACLRPLTPKERHSKAALVCKRWAAAVNSPQLIQSLDLSLWATTHNEAARAASMARARALLQWMLQHSAAVQQLQLSLDVPNAAGNDDAMEWYALADGCLAACGPHLHELRLTVSADYDAQVPTYNVQPWFLHMTGLHTLELETVELPLRLLVGLGSLASLRKLSITADSLIVGPAVALPPALTHLGVQVESAQGAFNKVPYESLSSLRLSEPASLLPIHGMAALASMSRLTKLELNNCGLPAANACPPSLRSLGVWSRANTPQAAGFDDLLQPLTGLTGLALSYRAEELPDTLAQLSQLQWLFVHTHGECGNALHEGGWVGSLRRLALEYNVAEASTPQLAQATRLSHLSLVNLPEKGPAPELLSRWAAFWQFVASHPPLRILDFREGDQFSGAGSLADMLEACMSLAVKRPGLRVAVIEDDPDWPVDDLQAMAPAESD